MSFDHIHLGAGRRGLGIVLRLALEAGARTHVVAHAGSMLDPDAELVYSVQSPNGDGKVRKLQIASLSCANQIDRLHAEALTTIREAPELLFTTALSAHGVDQQTQFIVSIVNLRGGKPTIFIPCEDDLDAKHADLLSRLEALDVDVRRSVITGLCSRDTRATQNGRRAVRVERQVEWIIDGEPTLPALEALAATDEISFSHDLEAHARRARWLCEGMELALVVLAADGNQPTLLPSAAAEYEAWLRTVCRSLVPLVESTCRELPDTAKCAKRQLAMLLGHKGDTLDVLHDRLRRGNPRPFLRSIQRAVGEPCRALKATTGSVPAELQRLVYDVGEVLGRIECYPQHEVYLEGDAIIDPAIDWLVVRDYQELLTGIFAPDAVDSLVRRLARALAEHRSYVGG